MQKEISKELMLVAWYPTTRYNFCMPEDEKKKNKIDPFLIDEKKKKNIYFKSKVNELV